MPTGRVGQSREFWVNLWAFSDLDASGKPPKEESQRYPFKKRAPSQPVCSSSTQSSPGHQRSEPLYKAESSPIPSNPVPTVTAGTSPFNPAIKFYFSLSLTALAPSADDKTQVSSFTANQLLETADQRFLFCRIPPKL